MAKRRDFSKEEILDICDSYKKTLARKPLSEKYNCNDKVILRILLENQVEIRHRATRPNDNRRYKINDDYFNINYQSHNSAYILGLLASDGCVASSQNQIYIELQKVDRELLEKINIELKNERPIKDYFNRSKNYYNSKLYFFSKTIKGNLRLYNIVPNKTHYNNDFLQNIEECFYSDFIRGYFDGDGSIKWTNGSIQWQIDSTSLKTLQHIQDILKTADITTKIVTHNERGRKTPLYRIYCYGYDNNLKIFKLFYQDSPSVSLRMKRKQKHFTELLLRYKSHETSNLLALT